MSRRADRRQIRGPAGTVGDRRVGTGSSATPMDLARSGREDPGQRHRDHQLRTLAGVLPALGAGKGIQGAIAEIATDHQQGSRNVKDPAPRQPDGQLRRDVLHGPAPRTRIDLAKLAHQLTFRR
jgi:hypothetical protein